ncbi:hypothetical protein F2981_20275 (plasmid) [Sinorhizobium meliloti]|nr:hypothetical protein [Sinorhizobium meliloti]
MQAISLDRQRRSPGALRPSTFAVADDGARRSWSMYRCRSTWRNGRGHRVRPEAARRWPRLSAG